MENLPIPAYSSISRRLGAMILDGFIVAIPAFIIGHIIPVVGPLLVLLAYAPVLESSEIRATIGKHLMGIQVTDLYGSRISFRTALIRYFMKLVSSFFLFLGHFLALFTERRQALHDLVAETVVVYGRSEKPIVDAWMEQTKTLLGSTNLSRASNVAELERLQALRERGALTEEEFQAQKKKILGL